MACMSSEVHVVFLHHLLVETSMVSAWDAGSTMECNASACRHDLHLHLEMEER
ncbi:hypothetical protein E4U32_005007 [Claviceps aff. humidiphila group G2b]|nr:hypothetical protein E4U32_005007 [Claviceps aff. humidiphila group G2b]